MTQKDLFLEFMMLCYKKPGTRNYDLTDTLIKDPYIIVRCDGIDMKVLYLYSGLTINIPWKWIDTFRSYNVQYGSQALDIGSSGSELDKFIYNFLMLLIYLDNKKGDDFLGTIYQICRTGTEKFRKMISDELGEEYDPITLDNLDGHLII